jgi:hypothetical protein
VLHISENNQSKVKSLYMRMKILSITLLVSSSFFLGCEKDYNKQATVPPPPVQSASWLENFTDAGALGSKGWIITNNTDKPGPEAWRKGRYESTNKYTNGFDYVVGFPAYSSERSPNDFISVDMYAGSQVANMSVWLITPITKMKNGDQLVFYSRAHVDDGTFSGKDGNDRMQVRGNFKSTSSNVGNEWTTVGDFTNLLLDINPSLALGGYPETWTKYTITLSGITGTINGRFAFRYFVPTGGPDGNNASLIGVDEVSFISK